MKIKLNYRLLLSISLLLVTAIGFSQKKKPNFYSELLNAKFKPAKDRKDAVYFKYVKKDSLGTYQLRMYRKKRVPYLIGTFWDYECTIPHGLWVSYHHEGSVKDSAYFNKGKLEGTVKSFYAKGSPKRVETYRNDSLISQICYSWEGHDTTIRPFRCLPEYQGGAVALSRYIRENLDYPRDAAQRGIQGVVIVGLVVNQDASVSSVKVLKSPSSIFNYEAERIIKETKSKWEPGQEYGEKTDIGITVPVFFILQE